MYVIDLTHFLDARGAIAPERGPARKFADFHRPDETPGPFCFKCRKRDRHVVDTGFADVDRVAWRCVKCGTEGLISNWQGSFRDMSSGLPSA